jgi:cytochrome c551/c552
MIKYQLFIWKILRRFGVWGSLPMGAHSSLNKDEAKSMVKYILTLKK